MDDDEELRTVVRRLIHIKRVISELEVSREIISRFIDRARETTIDHVEVVHPPVSHAVPVLPS